MVTAAISVAASEGLASLTVARVARAAGVSSALIHYHLSTKKDLIGAAEEALALEESAAADVALGLGGLAVPDELWRRVSREARSGAGRLKLEIIVAQGRGGTPTPLVRARERRRALLRRRVASLFEELDAALPVPAAEAAGAIMALEDGATLALTAGEPEAGVKGAWDAFWLAMVAAGQRGR